MVDKILVRAPETLDKIVHSFPFFYKLKEKYPEAQLNIIANEGLSDFYRLLPFKCHLYELPDDKNSFLGGHHFSANLHDVFNIDIFFDLVGDSKSAFIGRSFKAQKRVGYVKGMNKFLLTHKHEEPTSAYADRYFMNLLEKFEEEDFSDFVLGIEENDSESSSEVEVEESNVISFQKIKEEKEKKTAENPFEVIGDKKHVFLVSIDTFKENEKQVELWKEFFKLFENQIFVFWNFWSDSTMEKFIAELGDKNEYIVQSGDDFIKYNELITRCDALITNQVWLSYIALMKEKIPFLFTKKPKDLISFGHVVNHKHVIEYDDESMIKIMGNKGDDKDIRVTDEIVDFIHDSLKL